MLLVGHGGGCVYDVDRIIETLEAGKKVLLKEVLSGRYDIKHYLCHTYRL